MHRFFCFQPLFTILIVRSILGIVLVAGIVGCGSSDDAADTGTKTLSWTAVPDPSVLGYKAYWGTSTRHYESNADAGANTSYTVTGLRHGATYFFAVSAYNSGGESGLSAEVSSVVE
jgi:hypothetical protein